MESTLILRQDKVLDVDETDNIVFIILIDRKPCAEQFLPGFLQKRRQTGW